MRDYSPPYFNFWDNYTINLLYWYNLEKNYYCLLFEINENISNNEIKQRDF